MPAVKTSMLSCNLDKIALLRNSRDGFGPDPLVAASICIANGAGGLTLHPRADLRHALFSDLRDFSRLTRQNPGIELNIEGDLRPDLIGLIHELEPEQFTVVPVDRGEKTSSRGWRDGDDQKGLVEFIKSKSTKTRVSVFVDASLDSVTRAIDAGASSVEFYTGDFALAEARLSREPRSRELQSAFDHQCQRLRTAAELARKQGARINAGHDLTLMNLGFLVRLIHPDEVSIGHSLIADALVYGLAETVQKYCQQLRA
ncbi:MAG: pyridoxine 5'-phosphate synthase [Candidatus Pacebacteria bacterium]|nr:pyridoxine 5'-phosphate synthase [Candidatus Paceibacterota bacterium]